jgi:hypothetical protein
MSCAFDLHCQPARTRIHSRVRGFDLVYDLVEIPF